MNGSVSTQQMLEKGLIDLMLGNPKGQEDWFKHISPQTDCHISKTASPTMMVLIIETFF